MSIVSKITQAVAQLAPDCERDPLTDASQWVGKPVDRVDGRDKVTGKATFAAEHPLENLVHAALAYSAVAKGTIQSMDTSAAQAAPGVIAIITHLNAPRMKDPPPFSPTGGTDAAGSTANVLNTDRIVWNGQPVAIVVADTWDRAEYAASLVKITCHEKPADTSFAEGRTRAEPPSQVMGEDTEVRQGDAQAALAAAPVHIDFTYTTPRYNHNALEPHAVTAVWNGDKLTVYDCSQFVQGVADTLAKMFALNKEDVRVLAPFVGGGFGGKGSMWSHVQLCVLAAKVVDRPVKLALSREGVYRIVGGRTASEQRVALGAEASGKLTALIHTGVTAMSTTNDFAEQFSFPARHMYASENLFITQFVIRLNSTANTSMRAPGESIGSFALESALDELAWALNIDPVALRLQNEPERDPTKGTEFSSRHLRETYHLGMEKFGWQDRPAQVRSQRDGEWLIGQGMAAAYYPYYRLPTAARVRINGDGTALVQTSAQEMGMGTATAQTQIAAEILGLPMEKVRFEYGDTRLPTANQAGGSSQTVSVALAVEQAFAQVQKELLALARNSGKSKDGSSAPSPLAQAAVKDIKDIEARNGGLYHRDRPDAGESYAAILLRARRDYVEAEANAPLPLELMKYSMGSYGAQFCEVRVHARTGETRVSRWVGAFDTGRIINPKMAHSQFRGGIIMGIGMALTEETLFDERSGRIANPSLAEYHVPVNADIPHIQTYFLDIPDPHTPLGAHGIGEIGITGGAAAIANAIYHATGKRVRNLPITLDKLL